MFQFIQFIKFINLYNSLVYKYDKNLYIYFFTLQKIYSQWTIWYLQFRRAMYTMRVWCYDSGRRNNFSPLRRIGLINRDCPRGHPSDYNLDNEKTKRPLLQSSPTKQNKSPLISVKGAINPDTDICPQPGQISREAPPILNPHDWWLFPPKSHVSRALFSHRINAPHALFPQHPRIFSQRFI